MTDNPYQQTVREFMELWQEKTRHMMEDERFLDSMLDMMYANRPSAAAQQNSSDANGPKKPAAQRHAAHAPDAAVDAIAQLSGRIARLEARVRALEGEKKPAKKPAARARRPVPADER